MPQISSAHRSTDSHSDRQMLTWMLHNTRTHVPSEYHLYTNSELSHETSEFNHPVLKRKKTGLNKQTVDMTTAIEISDLTKSYQKGKQTVPVLKNVNLKICQGDFVALLGKSGSGKSSLLNIIGLLDNFDSGSYRLNGHLMSYESETQLARTRNEKLGMIFQSYNLLPFKNAQENIALPLYYRKVPYKERMKAAMEILDMMELSDRAEHFPNELSGGESQRVAIGRAIAGKPGLILADEPTGALDSATGEMIMNIFQKLNQAGHTILIVTHDQQVASYAGAVYEMKDGQLLNHTA